MKARLQGILCEVEEFFTDEDGKQYVIVRPVEFDSISREVETERITLES